MREERPVQGMRGVTSWVVQPGSPVMRLDAFSRETLPHLSLRELQRAIAEGAFRVNGRLAKKGDLVRPGDRVSYHGPIVLLAAGPVPRRVAGVEIIYEDPSLLVVDKPAGMPTHGFSGRETNSLANHLVALRPELGKVGKSPWEPGLVHRLDRDTSGLVLVAKDEDSFADLRAQFRSESVRKKYWALVCGRTQAEGRITYALIHDPKDRRKMKSVTEAGGRQIKRAWAAVTRYRTAAQGKGLSLVEVEMISGVTHQIRAHFAAIGHPLVGDCLYGNDQCFFPSVKRQFLHARYLRCRHPKSGAAMSWESPLPDDLREVLKAVEIEV